MLRVPPNSVGIFPKGPQEGTEEGSTFLQIIRCELFEWASSLQSALTEPCVLRVPSNSVEIFLKGPKEGTKADSRFLQIIRC